MAESAQPHPAGVHRYEPLVPAAAALVGGILAGEYLGGPILLWCLIALAAVVAWVLMLRRRAPARPLLVLLIVLVVAAGAARYRSAVDPPPDDVARLVPEGSRIVVLEGVVVDSPKPSRPPSDVFLPTLPYYVRTSMKLDVSRACIEGTWYPARGRVHTTVRQPPPDDASTVPNLGDRVHVTGRLMRPMGPSNPGSFDVAAYFRRQGVRATLSTDHWEAVRVVEPAAAPLRWAVGAMGRWAVHRFEAMPSQEGRAVAAAIVLGRRDLLRFDAGQADAEDIERAFIVTGTAHFLAVSGFCVGLAAGVVLLVMRIVGAGPKVTAAGVFAVVMAYAMMTELRPPVVRAAILIAILCLAWATGREGQRLNSLAAAVIVVLVIRPGDLFTSSFQLSFAVVLGMFWLVVKIEQVVFRRAADPLEEKAVPAPGAFSVPQYARRTASLSMAAALVAVPLSANQFHLVSWLAPVASVLLAPLAFLLVAGSMALVVLGAPAAWLGDLLAAVPDGMARAIVGVVDAMSRIPGGHIYAARFSGGWLIVTYGLLAAWVWRERLGLSRRRLAIAVLAAVAVFLWTGGHPAPAGVRATFLSVGSANTNLVELPNGRVLLYDAGSSLSYARAGEGAVAPALWSRGVERVDAIFLSHAHFDHFKDVLPLVERFGVRQVFVPPTFLRRRLTVDDAVIRALLDRGTRVTYFSAGDTLAGTGGVTVRGVWPRGEVALDHEINNGSLVLEMTDRGRRLLLAGDIEPLAIAALLEAEPGLRADALLWPHHGHAPDEVRSLVRHTGANVAVISAASGWDPPVLPGWLTADGVMCYHTGRDGAVTVQLSPAGVRAGTFRSQPGAGIDSGIEQAPRGDCPWVSQGPL